MIGLACVPTPVSHLPRPERDRAATRVDVLCTHRPEPTSPGLDRERLYWELSRETQGATRLGRYTLDRSSLYVNGQWSAAAARLPRGFPGAVCSGLITRRNRCIFTALPKLGNLLTYRDPVSRDKSKLLGMQLNAKALHSIPRLDNKNNTKNNKTKSPRLLAFFPSPPFQASPFLSLSLQVTPVGSRHPPPAVSNLGTEIPVT